MHRIDRSALVLHPAEAMYQLVNDVENYPAFLPGCTATRLIWSSDDEMVAELTLAKAGIEYSFQTRNRLVPGRRVELHLEEGPFKSLEGVWQFTPLSDEACKIQFHLEFEVEGRIRGLALTAILSQVANHLVDAFCKRADEIYGKIQID